MTSPSHSHISSSTSSASPFSRQRPTQAPMPPPGSNSFTPAYNPLSSPCFVHSHLDSAVSGSARRGGNHSEAHPNSSSAMTLGGAASSAYFDGEHGMQSRLEGPSGGRDLANGLAINSTPAATAGSNGTASPLRQRNHRPEPRHRGAQGAVEPESGSEEGSDASTSRDESAYSEGDDEDEDHVRSLTRQLAETAVGVREMSKQLGRARVKSTINTVLIITKARDNHLIKLTRELAIWLMDTPRNGRETGLVVYVDSQLRQSKRFDADGIRKEFPHLFIPQSARSAHHNHHHSHSPSADSSNSSRTGSISHGRDEGQLRYWTSDMCSRSPHLFDFVVTLGGDGTVLFCSWLFQRIVPPVMPFALGSLGFLTNFEFNAYKKVMKSALDTGIRVNLRMRFTATVYRATLPSSQTADRKRRRAIRSGKTGEIIMRNIQEGGWNRIETPIPDGEDLRGAFTEGGAQEADPTSARSASAEHPAGHVDDVGPPDCDAERSTAARSKTKSKKDKEVMCFSTKPVETFEVLNDLVVDRGPSPYVSLLEVFGDEHHMTTAQADGLCISTPTGSTAYSLSAGGSLVHPEIPAILITPICPHTLSFRPMLLPDSMELRIAVPYNSRSTAWASFDGRGRVELKQGDHIKVTASRYPFPTVCNENQSKDWFESISRTLKWNERQRQKSFVVVEEGEDDETDRKKDRVKNASKKIEAMQREKREALDKRPKDDGAAQVQHEKQRAELGLDGDDDDEVDEEEDEEEEEETFDIDDTSAAATRASSPMQRASSSGSRRSSQGQDVGNSRLRTSSSQGALPNLSRLHPLTSTKDQGSEKRRESQRNESESSTPSSAGTGKFMPYQHGVIQPSTGRSILDSPDRFGLPGPPNPPRAISERHLATADFRLDDEDEPSMLPPPEQPAKNNNPSAEGAKRMDGAAPLSPSSTSISVAREPLSAAAAAVQGAAEALKARQVSPAEHTGSSSTVSPSQTTTTSSRERSSSSRRRPRSKSLRLKSSDNASNTVNMNGIEESATSGSSGGTALVVYGQDESDSDSTAEG